MKLFPKSIKPAASYETLLSNYETLKSSVAHTARGNYQALNDDISAAGMAIIAHEREHGIREAREDLDLERSINNNLAPIEKAIKQYSGLSRAEEALVAGLVDGTIAADELEARARTVENYDVILKVARESLSRMTKMLEDIAARLAKLPKSSTAAARLVDPLGKQERLDLEDLYQRDRVNCSTAAAFSPTPELATA